LWPLTLNSADQKASDLSAFDAHRRGLLAEFQPPMFLQAPSIGHGHPVRRDCPHCFGSPPMLC